MVEAALEDRSGGEGDSHNSERSPPVRRQRKSRYLIHKRRPRKPVSCGPCRHSKLKCDRQHPCGSCKRRECAQSCTYRRNQPNTTPNAWLDAGTAPSPISLSSPLGRSSQVDNHYLASTEPNQSPPLTNPIPATSAAHQGRDRQNDSHGQWDALLQRPTEQPYQLPRSRNDPFASSTSLCFPFPLGPALSRSEIIAILPPSHCCDYLVTEYFTHLSPLFPILHGPTFQKQYDAFMQSHSHTDLSWLALLFAICSATANTMENDDTMLIELWPDASRPRDVSEMAYRFRAAAMTCLSQDEFMIRHNLSTLEALLVLIYTISNHEGAERSWTLLGDSLTTRE